MGFDSQKRRTFLAKSALTGGFLAASTGSASAADRVTVDPDDPSAYDSIQAAVHQAPDGATVEVASGTYNEQVWVPSKRLTLRGDPGGDDRGAGPDAPVLDGEGATQAAGFTLENDESAPPLTIEGFVIRNYGQDLKSPGEPNDEWGSGIKTGYRTNVTVRDVSVDHVAGTGVGVVSDGRGTSRNWTVERCRFDSIAHTAVRFASVADATVANNEVTVSDPVPDAEGAWWEQNTPDGHPVYGIWVAASAGNGHAAASRNVVVEDNDVTGRFDSAGIKLFAHNTDGERALVEQVTVRNNAVELTDAGDDSIQPNEKHGVILDANPGPDVRPAAIRNVVVEGNSVVGANHAYKFNAMAPFTADGEPRGGIRTVVCRGNEATDCNLGCIPLTTRQGELADVTVERNRFDRCNQGVVLWSRGRSLGDADVLNNDFHRESRPPEDVDRYGVEIVAHGADVDGVRVSGSTIRKFSHAVIAFGLGDADATNVAVEDCTLADNHFGMANYGYPDSDSTLELSAERTVFEDNGVGVVNLRNASASDLHVHSCDFRGHSESAAANWTGTGVLDATCNYWGHPTGPSHSDNRRGRGEPVTDGVDYDPLLPQSFEKVPSNACHPLGGNSAEDGGVASQARAAGAGHRPEDLPRKRPERAAEPKEAAE